MGITFDPAGIGTITVTGYTELAPCTFEDIYQADVAGGWGKVTKLDTAFYFFTCRLVIGDNTTPTWFHDYNCAVVYTGVATGTYWCRVATNATMIWGTLVDETNKVTRYGVHLYSLSNGHSHWPVYGNNGTCYYYSCSFDSNQGYYLMRMTNYGPARFWNCLLMNGFSLADSNTHNVYNTTILFGGDCALMYEGSLCVFDRVSVFSPRVAAFKIGTNNVTVRSLYKRGTGHVVQCVYYTNPAWNLYLIDADCVGNLGGAAWTFSWPGSPESGKIWRQYSFDLHVVDDQGSNISGAAVKVWDADGTLVVDTTTAVDGTITTQTLNYGYYSKQTGGDTPVLRTPHRIQVSASGYRTLDFYMSIDEKTALTLGLPDSGGGPPGAVVEVTDTTASVTCPSTTAVVEVEEP